MLLIYWSKQRGVFAVTCNISCAAAREGGRQHWPLRNCGHSTEGHNCDSPENECIWPTLLYMVQTTAQISAITPPLPLVLYLSVQCCSMLPMWGVRPGEVRGAGRQGRAGTEETGWIGTLSCSFLYRPHYTQQRPAPTLQQHHTVVIGYILQSKYLLHLFMRQASCAVSPLSVHGYKCEEKERVPFWGWWQDMSPKWQLSCQWSCNLLPPSCISCNPPPKTHSHG